ncbi:MAG: ATPase [Bacteroidetes bacterium GWC2_33_15]|nr:MAG: ATPase [Bacteroidetes bacterium GWA2_33_15]OFX50165.1 MAG: ATPase [Bacteroidetes bacterium GWC2_33_15]OFX65317.1 MAG: ATPase [Bacteroidetes bacterium GWB2_32_14]OFX70544.1 MAG: ATPase [Bacteroidetes bacterium GWD2_33_33]HAN19582.1 ATPase [Bacteroidales bacterium]
MIKRQLEDIIKKRINSGKAIILLGPRQTGKTTLLNKIATETGDFLLLDCDEILVREKLEDANIENLKQLIGKHNLVFIDEAQRVKNIGLSLKIIADRIKNVQLLVSGSSALELADQINEPLTGRKWEYLLLPISWQEFYSYFGYLKTQQQLEQRLIYGMYPDVINHFSDEEELLKQLSNSYLYKDLLALKSIRKPELLPKLLQALALQLGNEVSMNELSNLLKVSKDTIASYIDLLEKTFIIFRLEPFSRNLRNEISTNRKIYFYDNGIRNALISNYNPLSMRQDTGALWENFLISERKKYLLNNQISANIYFWRTTQKQEIDYIEEKDGKIYAYEFKWNVKAKARISKTFIQAYSPEIEIVNKENFEKFIMLL